MFHKTKLSIFKKKCDNKLLESIAALRRDQEFSKCNKPSMWESVIRIIPFWVLNFIRLCVFMLAIWIAMQKGQQTPLFLPSLLLKEMGIWMHLIARTSANSAVLSCS